MSFTKFEKCLFIFFSTLSSFGIPVAHILETWILVTKDVFTLKNLFSLSA